MAFRRRVRRSFRRRRKGPETYTRKQCRICTNVYGDMPCSNPLIEMFELLSMSTARNVADPTELTTPANKAIVFDGMKFQSEYLHDPTSTFDSGTCDPPASALVFILTIWEAVMLLPTGQGSTVAPAYLPNIVQGVFQDGDTADRVLWKRMYHMRIFGTTSSACAACPFLETTTIQNSSGPVAVKARCRIDDRHALYFVRNYTHDIAGLGSTNICCSSSPCCSIPIVNDALFKIFYHTR